MALSGSFKNYPVSNFGLYCEWSATQSKSGNYSDVTLNVYLHYYEIYVGARSDSTISINGESETYTAPAISHNAGTYYNRLLKSKTVRVKHNADGTKNNVSLSASWRFSGTYSGVSVGTITASTTINLDAIPTYSLSISAGTGSNITVNRTSSGYGGTGNLSNGARLYYNDKLKITFTPSTNYAISTHTVNGSTFSSGNTYTVSGNVSVKATAQVLASSIGATDANIGSSSSVVVTKYNSSYYHSLQYKFGSLSGYITSSGEVQSSEVKFSNTSIAFKIPTSFYAEIPNSPAGKCTITCRTYSSSGSTTVLGNATTCTITITATGAPDISGTVIDTNTATVALTGDSSKLIRYKSTATATITATAKNSASIVSKFINGDSVSGNTKVYQNCSETSFVFKTTDSRGYSSSVTITPTVIAYIQLTINPILSRPTPTGSDITMSFSGDFYRGSFGAMTNTLTIRYRYKESDGSYGAWKNIESTKIVFGTRSYTSSQTFSLDDEFNYQKEYHFQIQAIDGNSEHQLSTVTKTVIVPRGVPVFDWGKNDFNFHVPVEIDGNTDIDGNLDTTGNANVDGDLTIGGAMHITNGNESVVMDYIVEQGLSGTWFYRKWNSGIAECWGEQSFTISLEAVSTNIYYTSGSASFPFTFVGKPVVIGSCPWSYANWVNAFPDSSDRSKCGWLYYQTNTNGNNGTRSVYIHAIGKWK